MTAMLTAGVLTVQVCVSLRTKQASKRQDEILHSKSFMSDRFQIIGRQGYGFITTESLFE
jgi:hypothetical protein